MDSGTINVSTGPVRITGAVKVALAADPLSHRSADFVDSFHGITDFLCKQFNVRNTFLLSGSGTLANEAMLHQVKQIKGRGLILSNGEFGTRLIRQAQRIGLEFDTYSLNWGEAFELENIEKLLRHTAATWMVFTHCETSTGVINDLDALAKLAKNHRCLCFCDCMSTVGTRALDLSHIAMAAASSGKGLASVPGLAIVFSNIKIESSSQIPSYINLRDYSDKGGIPFTLSSNLVNALGASIKQKMVPDQFALLEKYRQKISQLLHQLQLVPFDNGSSFVFTLVPNPDEYNDVLEQLLQSGLIISYESEYLKKRRWIQMALFNDYQEEELMQVLNSLKKLQTVSS